MKNKTVKALATLLAITTVSMMGTAGVMASDTEENHRQFFIPRGFAHGFVVLTEEVIFQYKCDNFYAPQCEGALAWDDPALKIDWKVPADKIILSGKDQHHERLEEAGWLFDYNENLY